MNLIALAEKYERKEFLVGDPSWFMHQVEGDANRELLAFIASSLSYGSRKQFMPKIQIILDASKGKPKDWLLEGGYNAIIPQTDDCFYRLYNNRMMNDFLTALALMVGEYGSMKNYLKSNMQTKDCIEAVQLITQWFREHDNTGIIPKDTSSSCKRVCMFLRWMVRTDSPVDLGIWSDIIDRRTLIIPMDTHVVQESVRIGLTSSRSTSMSAARKLTSALREYFPDDPTKADFALFGIGVDEEIRKQQ